MASRVAIPSARPEKNASGSPAKAELAGPALAASESNCVATNDFPLTTGITANRASQSVTPKVKLSGARVVSSRAS